MGGFLGPVFAEREVVVMWARRNLRGRDKVTLADVNQERVKLGLNPYCVQRSEEVIAEVGPPVLLSVQSPENARSRNNVNGRLPWSREEKAHLAQWCREGLRAEAIASRLGRSEDSIKGQLKVMRQAGVDLPFLVSRRWVKD